MKEKAPQIEIAPMRETELAEAGRIMRLAFGTFLNLPNPMEFMGDRDFLTPRWRARHTAVLAARDQGKLIGSNVVVRWGSFGFFGPLTVLPEYWNKGVAQQLLARTQKIFDKWGVRSTGLFTFASSPKHVGLYQKFGYWPGSLTALMRKRPAAPAWTLARSARLPESLSALAGAGRREAIACCAKLTNSAMPGLDLTEEIRAALKQGIGEVILLPGKSGLDAFAICMHGVGSEGGAKTCYVKFALARGGAGAGDRFSRMLGAIDAFALSRGADVEAGINLACEDACRRMRAHGFDTMTLGVAMMRPGGKTFNGPKACVINDWR